MALGTLVAQKALWLPCLMPTGRLAVHMHDGALAVLVGGKPQQMLMGLWWLVMPGGVVAYACACC